MNENALPPDDDPDLLLAEYALGVLSDEERQQVEALAAQDPQYQALIAAWQTHFIGWLDDVPEAEPPARVWQAIETQLFPREPQAQSRPGRWWDDLRVWRWTAALALAALVAVSLLQWAPQPPAQSMLARLEQDDGSLLFSATLQADGRSVLFVPTRALDWQGKSAQAWVIAGDGTPRSLGLLPSHAAVVLSVPQELAPALVRGSVLAISLEPPTGSPTGLPTGPVVAKGEITAL